MTLETRCRDFLTRLCAPDLPYDSEVDSLKNFVLSEVGRAADERLEDCAPLVLYFADESGREELMAALMEGKPGMVSKRWPE